MATSGSVDYTRTALQIITAAFRKIGVRTSKQELQTTEKSDAITLLNLMFKTWSAQGLHLWTKLTGTIPVTAGQQKYLLGPDGDFMSTADNLVSTNLDGAFTGGSSQLTVDSTTGMSDAPNVLTSNPAATTVGWVALNSGVVSLSSGNTRLTNGIAVPSQADYNFSPSVGVDYTVEFAFVGSSPSAIGTLRIMDGVTVEGQRVVTAPGSYNVRFTATNTTMAFQMFMPTAGIGDWTQFSLIKLYNESTGEDIFITLDDGTVFQTKLQAVLDSTQLAIAGTLPSGAADGNLVRVLTRPMFRPLRILSARRKDLNTTDQIPLESLSRQEYFALANKEVQGSMISYYYSPTLDEGELYVYLTGDANSDEIIITFERLLEDIDDEANNLDIPVEWLNAVVYGLAARLADYYPPSVTKIKKINAKADETLDRLIDWDQEMNSINLQPGGN